MSTLLTFSQPSATNKERHKKTSDIHSPTTNTTFSIWNEESTIVYNFSHNDFLKMIEINNTSFKKEIVSSFKDEVAEKLSLNNLAITKIFNQHFVSFQKIMLQKIKDVVLQIIPNIPQQQHQIQYPPF